MVAGVIASVVRGARKPKRKRKKVDREELLLTPHRAYGPIKPFPEFGTRWVNKISFSNASLIIAASFKCVAWHSMLNAQ